MSTGTSEGVRPEDGVHRGVPPVLVGVTLVVVVLAADALWLLVPWRAGSLPAGALLEPAAGLDPAVVEEARRVQAALRLPALLALAATTLTAVLVVTTPAGRALLRLVRRRLPGTVLPTLVSASLVLLAVEVVRLPFAVWQEQVRLAEGLSVRAPAVFALDQANAVALRALPVLVATVVVVALARRLPRWWPAVTAALAAGFVVAASLLWPVVVEPRFATFEPLADGPLRADVAALAEQAGAPVAEVLVQDASTRTTTLNAYVSGLGPTRRLVLQDTLVAGLDEPAVRAVVAHEVAHAAAADLLRGTTVGALGTAAAVLVAGCLAVRVAGRHGGRRAVGQPAAAGAVVLALLLGPQLATPVESAVSRQVERAADERAVALTGDPQAYADMIRALTLANRSDPSPPAALQWWFGTHPAPAERVATAEAVARGEQTGAAAQVGP